MKLYLFIIILNQLWTFTVAGRENLITCDIDDDECAQEIVSELFGCDVVRNYDTEDYVEVCGTYVPFAVFNVTVVVGNACITKVSEARPVKLVRNYKLNQTLFVLIFDDISFIGDGIFIFSKFDDFDKIVEGNYTINYGRIVVTMEYPGAEYIDLTNGRAFGVALDPPEIINGPGLKEAEALDPVVALSLESAQCEKTIFSREHLYVYSSTLVDGYLSKYSLESYE